MAQRRIPVPRKAYDALAGIIDLGVERVRTFVEAVPRELMPIQTARLDGLIREWADLSGADLAVIRNAVYQVLLPANSMRLDSGLGPEEFLLAFRESVEERADEKWKAGYSDRWPKVLEALSPLFQPDNFFSITVKTTELLFERPAILLDANVLTELRPVYDESGDRIRSLLVTNTLVLTYSTHGEPESLHLTVDSNGLGKIARAVRRAGRKNSVAIKDASRWGVDVFSITGQESDDDEAAV